MLMPIMKTLEAQKIVLASSSPRRKEILEKIGLKFDIIKSNFEENLNKVDFSSPLEYVKETAKQKTLEVARRIYSKPVSPPDLIIGADTIVTLDGDIIEKPSSVEHACQMLSRYSNRTHTVITGVILVTPNKNAIQESSETGIDCKFKLHTFHDTTEVVMPDLPTNVIQHYVESGEPMDKAGGYGIQGLGCTLVESIKGDYFNIMGFPAHKFAIELLKLYSKQN
ncbi:hypothetical protein CHS0354_037114 [Potamilus streckersoni]|uniref:Maf-like protein n=1 Tax=Potamilus streckersoni TaxID=2493646 RepID=A0AAE0RPF0_9BIVA|nr:hypothetical protein CHS0354_037114 [Potamilus streckersoni]